MKYQSGTASGIACSVAKIVSDPFALSSFNINYSDCGLLGIYIKTTANCAAPLLTAVVAETSALADGGVPDKAVEVAKNSLKVGNCSMLQKSLTISGTIPHGMVAKVMKYSYPDHSQI